jgi:PAS domain S-box-containing protein
MPLDYQVLFEAAPSPYLILAANADFTIVAVNDAYAKATMTVRSEIVGKSLFKVFPDNPDDPKADGERNLRASLTRVRDTGIRDPMPIQKYDIRGPDGGFEVRYWSPVNNPVFRRDDNNKSVVEFIIHHVEDVTEFMLLQQKEQEQQTHVMHMRTEIYQHLKEIEVTQSALRSSNERYRLLASIIPVGIFHTDPEGNLIYANPKWQEITGIVDLTKVIDAKTPWVQLVHPDDISYVKTEWESIRQKQASGENKLEFRFLSEQTKQERNVLFQISPDIIVENGSVVQFYVGSITDITELKESEAARLKEAANHHQHLQQFIDSMCHELRNPLNGIMGNIQLVDDNLKPLQEWKEKLQVFSSPSLTAEEKTPSFYDDLSSTLTQFQEKLTIYMEQDKESVDAITACAKQQKIICDDVLNLSKLEAGKIELNYIYFNPKDVVIEVGLMLNTEIARKRQQYIANFPEKELFIYNDPARLKQILINLLTNAIKFTPNEGKITVSFLCVDSREDFQIIQFSVADTGIGMSEQEQMKIFERFSQAKRTTAQEYGGSGLGLVISRQLIELMGGNIAVESESHHGTTFTFTMKCPLEAESSPVFRGIPTVIPSFALPSIALPLATKKHILVVDDNLVNQKLLKRTLEPLGYTCSLASNGQEAVNSFVTHNISSRSNGENAINSSPSKPFSLPIDLILMDIEMPVMDGLEATLIIRDKEKEQSEPVRPLPIIGLSGYARSEQAKIAKQNGMTDYLIKPPDRKELFDKIALYTQVYPISPPLPTPLPPSVPPQLSLPPVK